MNYNPDPSQSNEDPYQSSPEFPRTEAAGYLPLTQAAGSDYQMPEASYPPPPPPPPDYTPSNPGYPVATPPLESLKADRGIPVYYSPPPPKKNRTWLWVLIGVLSVVVIGAIVGCSIFGIAISQIVQDAQKTATVVPTTTTESTTPTDTGNNTGTDIGGVVNIGQKHTYKGVDCLVTSVTPTSGDGTAQPKPGHQFVIIHIKITNNATEKRYYNPFDFDVITRGEMFKQEYLTPSSFSSQQELQAGDLPAGQSTEGDILVQVNSGDHDAKLRWKPTFLVLDAYDFDWKLGL